MAISKTNYKSNLSETIYNKIKTVVGTQYVNASLGNKTILYVGGYPPDSATYLDNLPAVIVIDPVRLRQSQYEQGGKRQYTDVMSVHVYAGGYGDDASNALMKNEITDLIMFGFDNKQYNYTQYNADGTTTVTGTLMVKSEEILRFNVDRTNIFERNHSEIVLTITAEVLNN